MFLLPVTSTFFFLIIKIVGEKKAPSKYTIVVALILITGAVGLRESIFNYMQ